MLPNNSDIQGKERETCGGRWVREVGDRDQEEKIIGKYAFGDIPSFFMEHIPSVTVFSVLPSLPV